MTLEEGQELVRSFNRPDFKLFIDRADIHQGPDGDYSLAVEPVEGEQQIFSEPEKANWALIEWMVKSAHANDRDFTLAEDGALKECDSETWINDWPNREKTRTKITCSPEIAATIGFVGCAPSMIVVLLSSSLRKRFFRSHTLKPRPLSQPRKPRHTGALVLDLMLEPSDLRRVPEGRFKPPINSVRVLPIFEYNLPIRTPVALLALLDSGGMAERSMHRS